MAVVNAGKNLLNKDSSIFLGKLSSCDNFVKKLTAFADPKVLVLKSTYSVMM